MTNSITYRGPSLRILHGEYAKAHRIDDRAPIQGRREIVIDAAPSTVWSKLVDVHSWAVTLEPGVSKIRVDQGVHPDAVFVRSNKGARMTARFAVVDVDREISWTGSAYGVKVVHRFQLEAEGVNATHVVVQESMAGPLLGLYFSNSKLAALLETSLLTLKAASETCDDPAAEARQCRDLG